MLIILSPQHIAHCWFGKAPGWRGGCKQSSLLLLTFIFPPCQDLIFHLHSKTAVLPLQTLWTWTEASIGSVEKGLRDAARRIHWQNGLMPVWRPPPGLPVCEWTSVNKWQTYTNAPAAIGPSQRGRVCGRRQTTTRGVACQGSSSFFFFYILTPIKEAPPQEGAWKDRSLTKTAGPGPASMDVNEAPSPHIAINTYSTSREEAAMGEISKISISKPRHNKGIKVHALFDAWVLLWAKVFTVSSKQLHFHSAKWNSVWPHHWPGRGGKHAERIERGELGGKCWLRFTLNTLEWTFKQ